MNKIKTSIFRTVLLIALYLLAFSVKAQVRDNIRKVVKLPDIPGYHTLKCDFHLHTVFSDGHVWPSFRVNEAVRDGLDAISVTEHIDYEGFPDEIKRDYNRSYKIASDAAKNKDLIVIPGVEISPRVPPYHHNALFITDANKLPIDYMKSGKKQFVMKDNLTEAQLMGPFTEAHKQGAFVFYNHPSYAWWDRKDTTVFTGLHQQLVDKNIVGGVEVVNSGNYNILAHKLAMEHNLTMIANSDEHYDLAPRYADTHRPMTLVFAKEKSAEGIREALMARRTALYFDDYILARQPEAEAFFKSAVTASAQRKNRKGEHILEIRLVNNSDVPFRVKASADYDIEKYPMGQVVLSAHATTVLTLKAMWKYPETTPLRLEVSNVLVSPEKPLLTEFSILTTETTTKL